MSYLPAISGLARSGVTFGGWARPQVRILIGGVAQVIAEEGFSIQHRAGGDSSATFTVEGAKPTIGATVVVLRSAASEYLFAGVLLQAEAEIVGDGVLWHCSASGWRWVMGHYLITRSFVATAINTILATIVADASGGGFLPGYCPYDDRVTVDFSGDDLPSAIDKLAKLAPPSGALWDVGPTKRVSLYATYPAATVNLSGTSEVEITRYREDLSQIRTRAEVVGQATKTTAAAPVGSTTIDVAEIGWFQPSTIGASSGQAVIGPQTITYTSATNANGTTYGPGTLQGVTGLIDAVAEGDAVATLYTANNTSAQTALAALIGGSGVVTVRTVDASLSLVACKARAEADVAQFGSALVSLDYRVLARRLRIGQIISVSLASPFALSSSFVVSQFTVDPIGIVGGDVADLLTSVSTGVQFRRLGDVIAKQ